MSAPHGPVAVDRALLRFWLTRRGLSQRQLARIVGLHEQRISAFITGARALSERDVEAIATALGITLAELLVQPSGDGAPPTTRVA